jgi:biotin synthase-related radical SAM superfamily protein
VVIEAINNSPPYVKRTCISMITNGKCRSATVQMVKALRDHTELPVSVLIAPTIIDGNDLMAMKDAGVDRIGVAVDLATPELFDKYRGKGVKGPHKWDRYWEVLETALRIFGPFYVGAHLMVGMGETEKEMAIVMNRLWRMGVVNHLFSFFAEEGSRLAGRPQPSWPSYLRIQLARYLLEEGMCSFNEMEFDEQGRITGFGMNPDRLTEVVNRGDPFMTTGCLGPDGQVACNRPFGNCLPGPKQWNYPYTPNEEELDLVRGNLFEIQEN